MAVNLFDYLCADKFFTISNYIDFFSKIRKTLTRISSTIFYKFVAIKVRPNIIPKRMNKNISRIRARLILITA